jgi:hypothetical protein
LSIEELQKIKKSKIFPNTVKNKIHKRIKTISDLSTLINLPLRNLQQLKNSKYLSEQQKQKVEERIIIKNAIQTLSLPEEYMDRNFETTTNRQKQILNGVKEKYNDEREKSFIEASFHNIRSLPDDRGGMTWSFDENIILIFYEITIFILQKIGYINHRNRENDIKLVLKGSRALQFYFENIRTFDTDVILISENNEGEIDSIMEDILRDLQTNFHQIGTFEIELNKMKNTKKILWKPQGSNSRVDIFDCFFNYDQVPDYYTTYTTVGDDRNILFYMESLENIKKEYTDLMEKYGGEKSDKFEQYKKNHDRNLYLTFTREEKNDAFNYFKFKNKLQMIKEREIEEQMIQRK